MISKAELNYLKIAPRKVRLVADLIRGKEFEKAQNLLRFTRKKASLPLKKLLDQALANAKNNYPGVKEDNLLITKLIVNEGPAAKRRLPRARGKADIIKKRTSHIELVLDEIDKDVKDTIKKSKPKKKKKTKGKKEKKAKKKPKSKKKEKQKRKKRTKKQYSKKKKGLRAKKKDQVFHKKSF